ncbi:thioesterase [Pontibacter sp. HJ8]
MTAEEHFGRLERLYHKANIQSLIKGSSIAVNHGQAELTLPVDPSYFHGAQAIHGSIYFKLLDDAAYFAAASLVQDVFLVTSSFQINLLRPVSSGTLRAVGTVRSKGKSLFVAEATLYNEKGKEVAFGTGQFMRTAQPLETLEGYG